MVSATAQALRFQSTLPVRGATSPMVNAVPSSKGISIHAPREGSDGSSTVASPLSLLFQSTLPVRGATARPAAFVAVRIISIHAPREGSDFLQT